MQECVADDFLRGGCRGDMCLSKNTTVWFDSQKNCFQLCPLMMAIFSEVNTFPRRCPSLVWVLHSVSRAKRSPEWCEMRFQKVHMVLVLVKCAVKCNHLVWFGLVSSCVLLDAC